MPRPHRPLAPGLLYHLTSRGNERRAIFRDDHDRLRFASLLTRTVGERRWEVHAACLMPNHVHLVLRTPNPDLSDGMRRILGDYARGFNDRHDRSGHLFGGRFHSVVVHRHAHQQELLRYVALNPVAAGLCATPEQFGWSTHAALAGLTPPPAFLTFAGVGEAFQGDIGRYAAFVADGIATSDLLAVLLGDQSLERVRIAVDAGFSLRQIGERLGISRSGVRDRLLNVA